MDAGNTSRESANWWVVVPFVLAVAGTVVMLFTNSANMLKLSLILALWAAAAGIIVISRLRRDRDDAQRALDENDRRHEAELDAVKARGEADRAALALARNDEDIPVGVDVEVLREIQAELKALRTQLEEMAGRQFEYEPAALRAEARRIAELGSADTVGSTRVAPAEREEEMVVPEPSVEPAVEPTEEPAVEPAVEPAPSWAAPTPSTADTTRIQPVRDVAEPQRRADRSGRPAGAPTSEAISGRLGTRPGARSAQHNPLSQLISERQAEKAPAKAPEQTPAHKGQHEAPEPAQEPTPEPAKEQPTKEQPARLGGRRRRDERGSAALSVAELLARSSRDSE